MTPSEFHHENSEELRESLKNIKAKAKKAMAYMWIMHVLGAILFISSIVYGKHMLAFISYIILMPDVDDLASYMRKMHGSV